MATYTAQPGSDSGTRAAVEEFKPGIPGDREEVSFVNAFPSARDGDTGTYNTARMAATLWDAGIGSSYLVIRFWKPSAWDPGDHELVSVSFRTYKDGALSAVTIAGKDHAGNSQVIGDGVNTYTFSYSPGSSPSNPQFYLDCTSGNMLQGQGSLFRIYEVTWTYKDKSRVILMGMP